MTIIFYLLIEAWLKIVKYFPLDIRGHRNIVEMSILLEIIVKNLLVDIYQI